MFKGCWHPCGCLCYGDSGLGVGRFSFNPGRGVTVPPGTQIWGTPGSVRRQNLPVAWALPMALRCRLLTGYSDQVQSKLGATLASVFPQEACSPSPPTPTVHSRAWAFASTQLSLGLVSAFPQMPASGAGTAQPGPQGLLQAGGAAPAKCGGLPGAGSAGTVHQLQARTVRLPQT